MAEGAVETLVGEATMLMEEDTEEVGMACTARPLAEGIGPALPCGWRNGTGRDETVDFLPPDASTERFA